MTPVPLSDCILCEKSYDMVDAYVEETNIVQLAPIKMPIYTIVDVSKSLKDSRFKVGDKVICNSTGTKIKLDSKIEYIFKEENILGKID